MNMRKIQIELYRNTTANKKNSDNSPQLETFENEMIRQMGIPVL